MTRIAVVLAVLTLLLAACGGSRTLTIDADGDRVPLSPGDEIRVALVGNMTTGFTWDLVEYDAAVIAPLGDPTYEQDGSGDAVGTGGTWTWTLRAVAEGESPVRFVYRRSWEDEDPASVFSFTATVDR
jgi:predicted secreted protein